MFRSTRLPSRRPERPPRRNLSPNSSPNLPSNLPSGRSFNPYKPRRPSSRQQSLRRPTSRLRFRSRFLLKPSNPTPSRQTRRSSRKIPFRRTLNRLPSRPRPIQSPRNPTRDNPFVTRASRPRPSWSPTRSKGSSQRSSKRPVRAPKCLTKRLASPLILTILRNGTTPPSPPPARAISPPLARQTRPCRKRRRFRNCRP